MYAPLQSDLTYLYSQFPITSKFQSHLTSLNLRHTLISPSPSLCMCYSLTSQSKKKVALQTSHYITVFISFTTCISNWYVFAYLLFYPLLPKYQFPNNSEPILFSHAIPGIYRITWKILSASTVCLTNE